MHSLCVLLTDAQCVLWCVVDCGSVHSLCVLLTDAQCVLWCVVGCGSVHSLCVLLTDAQCVLWCATEAVRVSAASHHWHQLSGRHCLGPCRCTAVS